MRPPILELDDGFYDVVKPATFPRHRLRFRNRVWDARIGLGQLGGGAWESHFARFVPLPENLPAPLALRYHGHQFRSYNPGLGDGRGFLFAQVRELEGERRLLDLGTKGSGKTPWSRSGDGRLTLKGGVREVLATEMLEALGVDTSKSLSLFETGEPLIRGDEPSPTRSSVLTRLSHSHVRYGTFQRLAAERDARRMNDLVDYCLRNLLPEVTPTIGLERVPAMLAAVAARAARTCGQWMVAGFVHGVLNTDNMNVTGESFDYGPYRFLPAYDPNFTAAYFDGSGLYAYGRQPETVVWNLERLAEALRLVSTKEARAGALDGYPAALEESTRAQVLFRLGLESGGAAQDDALTSALFGFLAEGDVPFDLPFFDLFGGRTPEPEHPRAALYVGPRFTELAQLLAQFRPRFEVFPTYFAGEAPCTLVYDEIERIWAAIADTDDWTPFCRKITDIRAMGAALRGENRGAHEAALSSR